MGHSEITRSGRPAVKRIILLLLTLMMLFIPTGTAGYLVFKYQTQQFEAPRQVWTEISEPQRSAESQLGLKLTWASPRPLVAPEWSGVVQTIAVAPGHEITNGTEIARINGIQRIAMLTAEPLYRPLSIHATGSDVAALNAFLTSQGFPSNDSDTFGGLTATGIRLFSEAIGVSPVTDVFDPGWVLFLNEPIIVESTSLTTGAPVPTPGEKVVTAVPRLQGASFISATSANRLLEADSNALALPTEAVTLSNGASISVAGTSLEIAEGSQELTAESVQALAPQLRPLAPATLALLDEQLPTAAWTIPASSVFVNDSGQACVVVRDSGDPFSVAVTILRSTDSDVLIDGLLKTGYKVALDPKLERMTCK